MLQTVGRTVIEANEKAFKLSGIPNAQTAALDTWNGPGGLEPIVLGNWAPVEKAAEAVEKAADTQALNLHFALKPVPNGDIDVATKELLSLLDAYHAAVERFESQTIESLAADPNIARSKAVQTTRLARRGLADDVRATGIATSGEVEGRLVGYSIFDRFIAKLSRDDDSWIEFGRGKFRTYGGSAQFVVVREGHVVFRQKSLDFDPTAIVGAGTAMARLGLRLGAAIATGGAVPVAANGASVTEGAALPTPTSVVDFKTLEENRLALERQPVSQVEALSSGTCGVRDRKSLSQT